MRFMHAESETRRLRDQLAASQKALQEFVYVVSHDLGAPLRAVSSFSGILQQKYAAQMDEKALTYLNFIAAGGAKAQAMLAGLLQYSRVETQAGPMAAVDLNGLVKQVLHELGDKIGASGASVRCEKLPAIKADGDQMKRLFMAVLDNALTYHYPEKTPHVEVSAEENRRGWRIDVSDDGIGIPPDCRERVFGVFRRLHADDLFPGIGMGLPIARRIMERHGGTIELMPGKASGTVCRMMFPKSGRA